jgi:hypothetical protein
VTAYSIKAIDTVFRKMQKYSHTHTHTYIYTYTERERERENELGFFRYPLKKPILKIYLGIMNPT